MYEHTKVLMESKSAVSYRDLSDVQQRCLDAAALAMQYAYAPYSNFYVGAAVFCVQDGHSKIISGANYENASYGLTICAERSTICTAQNLGYSMVTMLAVIARAKDFDIQRPTAPCGACRQFIVEAAQRNATQITVLFSNTQKSEISIATIDELLPRSFGPRNMV